MWVSGARMTHLARTRQARATQVIIDLREDLGSVSSSRWEGRHLSAGTTTHASLGAPWRRVERGSPSKPLSVCSTTYDGSTSSICGGAVSRTLRVEGQKKKTALVCLVSPAHCRHKHAVKHHEQLAPGWFVTNEKGNALFTNHFLSEAAADSCSGFADFRETALPLETMISFVASAAAGNFDGEEAEVVAEFVRAAVRRPSPPPPPARGSSWPAWRRGKRAQSQVVGPLRRP